MSIAVTLKSQETESATFRCFTALSMMLAILLGIGKQSWEPIFVVTMSVGLAWAFTEKLRWIRLNRLAGYLGMLIGASLALSGYLFLRENPLYHSSANLDAVSRMLINIQIPLMFQRKDKRLFEHWGVFLILELVVASLLSEHAVFGMLLIPTLMLGCAAMISLAAYVTETELNQGRPKAVLPVFSGWWTERRSPTTTQHSSPIKRLDTTRRVTDSYASRIANKMMWLPALCAAVFAVIYFFSLPRLNTGAYEGLGFNSPMVGFSGSVSLENVGELLMNNDLALRVFMQRSDDKSPFQPSEPPYIRGTVADFYEGRGKWRTNEVLQTSVIVPAKERMRTQLRETKDSVFVTVHEQAYTKAAMFSLPPFSRNASVRDPSFGPIEYDPKTWCMSKPEEDEYRIKQRKNYRFESFAFVDGSQLPYVYDPGEMMEQNSAEPNSWLLKYRETLTDMGDKTRFEGLIRTRDEILSGSEIKVETELEKILKLEQFLANSDKFRYSLRPAANYKNGLDPIEDFVTNHRTGHCQYFASALTMMGRSLGLPSRIILGFRPQEYNDVGNFFTVMQRHAHAWVEIYFTREQLAGSDLVIPDWVEEGVWLRLDPTPPAEGSNAGGTYLQGSASGQTYQTLEQLWQDGFVDYDANRQPSVFGMLSSSTNGPLVMALRSIEKGFNRLQIQNFFGIEIGSANWFNWQAGLAASIAALAIAFVVQSSHRLFNWAGDTEIGNETPCSPEVLSSPAYLNLQRVLQILGHLGWKRSTGQTLIEFAKQVQPWLDRTLVPESSSAPALTPLVENYYRIRFGESVASQPDHESAWTECVNYLVKMRKQGLHRETVQR
jgi:transglutaminase-like putative cysteine protease